MKKKLTYPLLALVVLLWGAIFYRIFAGLGDNKPTPPSASAERKPKTVAHRHTGDSLLLDYPDPFLERARGAPISVDGGAGPTGAPEQPEPVMELPYIDWSQVQYLGSVNSEGKKAIALVAVNGREYMLRPGETIDGYTLLSMQGSSITISHQGQVATLTMQGQ
ncbi:hypothetical protein SAMN05421747_12718 [Parapedobacter composti]|uniref:Type IV pilus biogenesis n=1 Tax=Parapedobacter composti TaxID=623281 RepID=A0A1I1M180_9SPHI|nr:hypothetical protein [Parapedobacter composti]SFC79267.1 hypothetical protein SAMN05421747_12718 [Parapedobacter composti]